MGTDSQGETEAQPSKSASQGTDDCSASESDTGGVTGKPVRSVRYRVSQAVMMKVKEAIKAGKSTKEVMAMLEAASSSKPKDSTEGDSATPATNTSAAEVADSTASSSNTDKQQPSAKKASTSKKKSPGPRRKQTPKTKSNKSSKKTVRKEPISLSPLPPTIATMNGFKTLLLNRRMLMKRSGHLLLSKDSDMNDRNEPSQTANQSEEPAKSTKKKGSLRLGGVVVRQTQSDKISQSLYSRVADKLEPTQEDPNQKILKNKTWGEHSFNPLNCIKKTADYQLLRARFRALFMWPALLSTTKIQQIDNHALPRQRGMGRLKTEVVPEVKEEVVEEEDDQEEVAPPCITDPKVKKRKKIMRWVDLCCLVL